MTAAEFWEDRYAGRPQVWSGRANPVLVELIGDLAPGRALDLGCGEGGDAIWLARNGWQGIAVDISTIEVERGHAVAVDADIPDDRIAWHARDLGEWQPEERYDPFVASRERSPVSPGIRSAARADAVLPVAVTLVG
nr:methyltransferase domain-containing protein [Propionicimonas sp.]